MRRIINEWKKTKKISILLIFVLSTITMRTTALALTQSDPYETSTINGHKYSFTSEVWDRGSGSSATVEAVAYVGADANVPTGYMGANLGNKVLWGFSVGNHVLRGIGH